MIDTLYIDDLLVHSSATPQATAIRKISGLGSPVPRSDVTSRTSSHGSINQTRFYDGRVIDLDGRVTGANIWSDFETLKGKLALGTDHTLRFRRTGRAEDEQLVFRVGSAVDNEADAVTSVIFWGVSLFAADPRIYSATLKSGTYDPAASISGGGTTVPLTFPLTFSATTASELFLTNNGGFKTPPALTIQGPVAYPIVDNDTTGESIAINYVLGTNDTIVVDVATRTLTLNGASRADLFVASASKWWEMLPGENRIRVRGSSFALGVSALTVSYRDANI